MDIWVSNFPLPGIGVDSLPVLALLPLLFLLAAPRVAAAAPAPAVSAALTGRVAVLSEAVMATKSVEATGLKAESTDCTVMLNAAPACCNTGTCAAAADRATDVAAAIAPRIMKSRECIDELEAMKP